MGFRLLEVRRSERLPHGDRRRNVRHEIGWPSRYIVADELQRFAYRPVVDHGSCVVHDLSTSGAGLALSSGELSVGDRVVLNLPLAEHGRASIQLTGDVRHTRTDFEGVVRAGIEFVDVGDLERALLMRLLRERSTPARPTD